MIHRLGFCELRNWGKHTVGVASEEDDVGGVSSDRWDFGIIYVLQWVSASGVFGYRSVKVVYILCAGIEVSVL